MFQKVILSQKLNICGDYSILKKSLVLRCIDFKILAVALFLVREITLFSRLSFSQFFNCLYENLECSNFRLFLGPIDRSYLKDEALYPSEERCQ